MEIKQKALKRFFFERILGGLEGNALGCVITEPMWAVFGGMIFFYQPLYMRSLGVSEISMGSLNSLLAILCVFTAFISGPLTDRFGRKRTTLVADFFGWSIPMFIWAISQNYIYFLIAAIFNSVYKIPYTSWTCLALEDTEKEKRAVFLGLITIINLASGIFAGLAGILISHIGIIWAMRIIYGAGFISMSAMFLLRNSLVEETTIGKKLMQQHSSISLREKWLDYKNAILYVFRHRTVIVIFIIMLLTNFQVSFQFFQVVYLKDKVGISEAMTSIIPVMSAIINLVIYFGILPKMAKRHEGRNLSLGLTLCVIGFSIFIFVGKNQYILLLISTFFTAAGNMIMSIFRDTIWNNIIGESERAKIFSACQGIISMLAIPGGIIAGVLYKANAVFPFIVSLVLFIISLFLARKY